MSNIEIINTGKGVPTLKINNRLIHSGIDPIREAQKITESISGYKIYIVFGLGLGYHIKAILEKLNPLAVIVIENESVIEVFKNTNNIYDERLKIFSTKEKDKIINFLEEFITIKTISNIKFFYLNSIYPLYESEYKEVENNIKTFLEYFFQSLFTEIEFSVLWHKNAILNIYNINKALSYAIEGDVVLIGAGPSLTKNIELIKRLSKTTPIICVDTALKLLIYSGIIPDMIVSLDSQIHNYNDFLGINAKILEKTILAFDITSYNKIPEKFDNLLIFKTENILKEFFEIFEERIKIEEVLPGGSVSASALSLIYKLGARSITLIGHDFEYNKITHSVSTPSYLKMLFTSDKKDTLYDKFNRIITKRGKRDLFMKNLKKWFEEFIENYKIEVYHIGSENRLKNAKYVIDREIEGRIYSFKKIPKDLNFIKYKLNTLYKKLDDIRCSENLEDFNRKIETLDEITKNFINKILIKQFLYLERKDYNPLLFLGGVFGVIDRIKRAIKISMGKL